jgi:hydrophobe/amphiphile efflux-3 (HAE3) family protein
VWSPFEPLAELVNRRPALVMAVFSATFLVALFGVSLLSMETGSDTYLDKNTERGMLLKSYTDTFSSDAIILLVEGADVLSPADLEYLDRLTRDIGDERYVQGVSGLPGLLVDLNGGTLPRSPADIRRVLDQVPPEIRSRLVPSPSMTLAIITLEPGLTADQGEQALNNLNSIVRATPPPPGVKVTLTGDAAFSQQMQQEMGTSMGLLIGAAMVLMVLAVWFLFSHVRYRLLSVAVVASGLILTFGIMGLTGIPISMIAIGAFPVLIGIGIDYSIQFHSRFEEESRSSPLPEAVRATITKAGPSVFLAMVSTSLGFIAMFVSPVPMVRDFGLICTIGVASCYLAGLVVVPTFGTLMRYRPRATGDASSGSHMEVYDRLLGETALGMAKRAVPLLILVGLVALVGFQLDNAIPINTNEDTFVPQDMPAVMDLKKVTRVMGSTSGLTVYIRGDDVTGVDTITWMDGFQDYELGNHDEMASAASIATYLALYNGGELPRTDAEVEQALEKIPPGIRDRYVKGTMAATIEFGLIEMENEEAQATVDRVSRDLSWMSPPVGVTARVTGMLEMFTHLIREINRSKNEMTLLGFGLIFLFLLAVYRRPIAVSPIVPIIFLVGWNGGIMYLLGIDYTPLTAVLGSMTVGVASEYTILIMERYLEERKKGRDLTDAVRMSVQKIGTAITVSGATTVFGFAALTLSSFNIVSNFGIVTVITVGISLAGAILVMPAVITVMERAGEWYAARRRSAPQA